MISIDSDQRPGPRRSSSTLRSGWSLRLLSEAPSHWQSSLSCNGRCHDADSDAMMLPLEPGRTSAVLLSLSEWTLRMNQSIFT